jgi:hypothetical protein
VAKALGMGERKIKVDIVAGVLIYFMGLNV